MEYEGIEPLGGPREPGGLKPCRAAEGAGSLPARREEVDHGKGAACTVAFNVVGRNDDRTRAHLFPPRVEGLEEAAHRFQRRAVPRVDQRHLDAKLAGQTGHAQRSVTSVQLVGHREHDQGRQAEPEYGLGDHQMGLELRGVQNEHHRVGLSRAILLTQKHVPGHHLVQAARRKTVHPRKVDHLHRAGRQRDQSGPPLDGHAGVVRNALP